MLYQNVLSLCEKQNISIARLERECNLGNATVRGWEREGCSPGVDTVKKVADFFGCTVDELLKEETQ